MTNEEKANLQKRESPLPQGVERTREGKVFLPPADIVETKDEILLTADMPGVGTDSVEITLEDERLTVSGRVARVGPQENEPAYAEYEVGDYQRSFSLSDEIDRDGIQARMANGVLTLTLPKTGPKRRRIEVTSD
jgi:HSP20 family protein